MLIFLQRMRKRNRVLLMKYVRDEGLIDHHILKENSSILKKEELQELSLEEIVKNKLIQFLGKFDKLEAMDLYETILQMVERPLISLVLKKTKGNQIQTAKVLGINRNTLRKKIRLLKIKMDRFNEDHS